MIAKLLSNRVRRTYLGGGRIDAFTGAINCASPATAAHTGGAQLVAPDMDGVPRPEDWMASTTTAFNGTLEIEGEGLGRLEDGRLVKDVVGTLPILVGATGPSPSAPMLPSIMRPPLCAPVVTPPSM